MVFTERMSGRNLLDIISSWLPSWDWVQTSAVTPNRIMNNLNGQIRSQWFSPVSREICGVVLSINHNYDDALWGLAGEKNSPPLVTQTRLELKHLATHSESTDYWLHNYFALLQHGYMSALWSSHTLNREPSLRYRCLFFFWQSRWIRTMLHIIIQ